MSLTQSKIKKLFKNKLFLIYLLLYLVTLISLSILYNSSLNKLKLNAALFAQKEAEVVSLQEKINTLHQLISVDELVIFKGEYQKALEKYDLLNNQNSEEINTLINKRKNYINQLLQDIQSDNQSLINKDITISHNKQFINSLQNENDSLKTHYVLQINSLTSQVENLEQEISKKEKVITHKENIKVISFKNKKGNTIHYLGEITNQKANGGGVGIWSTGSIYKGNWKNNMRHGKGTFEWADGEKYEGEFVNDIKEGQGTYYWMSGEKYVGEWKNDKRNGKGILYDPDNNIRYDGFWVNDKPEKE